ncbi:SDR family NAD(P)-dependent oxidoreductase [Nocardioides solisilvae]|uniref:SDR family NAD(P)-dependent oxidoreductase n=1 Tax=Nocardioides solisilvae TaxID=1542435 RepID=UPI0013A5468E|nr:SDR family oxidoreductase [Nocardioides solisilvae]
MIDIGFDFTSRHVLVTGGTRGVGLTVAQAFLDAGARVSVTGCKILPSLYDADLSRFEYHQLRLTSSDAIDSFVDRVGAVDVLVNAAGARLDNTLEEHEREFMAHSARLGFVGPLRLTHQLRQRLYSSSAPGGGAVIHTSASQRWLELTQTPADARAELEGHTARTGRAWSRLGARVNTVLCGTRPSVPVQPRQSLQVVRPDEGSVLTRRRTTSTAAAEQVATVALFLASSGGQSISGQTLEVEPRY